MKRILFIFFLMSFVLGLSAQRNVRKETHKGDKNYREQRYGAAEERYKKAIDLVADPKNKDVKEEEKSREAFYNLGNTYYRQGRWDEAIKEYSNYQAMEPDPTKQSGAWSNIGNSYLNKAIRKAPPKDPSQQQPGQEQQPQQPERLPRLEDLNKSKDAYRNALRLNPVDDESRYNLAVVQKMIKDQEDNNKDNNKDNKDQDKQQQKDQQQQQQKQDQQQKDQQQKKDQQDQQENQMSQQNIEQILNAIEQDEKETQARVQQQKAEERKKMNARNKRQSKDW